MSMAYTLAMVMEKHKIRYVNIIYKDSGASGDKLTEGQVALMILHFHLNFVRMAGSLQACF